MICDISHEGHVKRVFIKVRNRNNSIDSIERSCFHSFVQFTPVLLGANKML